jgi:pimeloyl-ACP methyl ester carboxylesterase
MIRRNAGDPPGKNIRRGAPPFSVEITTVFWVPARRRLPLLVRRCNASVRRDGPRITWQSTGVAAPRRNLEVVSKDGTKIVVIDEGAGKPIVVVHGGSSHADSWSAVTKELAPRYRVLSIERRLYGKSGAPQSPHSIAREVEDLEALFERIGEPVVLVGHSSGAVVALETALATPNSIVGLALYEPPVAVSKPIGGEPLVRARRALDRGNKSAAMWIHLRELVRFPLPQLVLLRCLPRAWHGMAAMAPGQITDAEGIEALGVGIERYASIKIPTLLIGGTASPANLRERLNALSRKLPRLHRISIMEGQGHIANHHAPRLLVELVGEFAASLFSPGRALTPSAHA